MPQEEEAETPGAGHSLGQEPPAGTGAAAVMAQGGRTPRTPHPQPQTSKIRSKLRGGGCWGGGRTGLGATWPQAIVRPGPAASEREQAVSSGPWQGWVDDEGGHVQPWAPKLHTRSKVRVCVQL